MKKDTNKNTRNNSKKKWKLRSNARLIIFAFAILLVVGAGAFLANEVFGFWGSDVVEEPGEEETEISGRKNVLLIGIDARGNERMARADTIMLASLDADENKAVVVSVPRDTRVEIPRHGMDRINSATVFGGPELLVDVVSDLFKIHVDGYVLCDYDGFIEIIDALGGVTMDIEENMYHYDPEDGGKYTINLRKGEQQYLDGSKALQFVRYRDYALADITRTQQQQEFLHALAGQVVRTNTILKLPRLVPTILRNVKTDLKYSDIMILAKAAKGFKDIEIACQTLPGYFLEMNGLSYWETNQKEARTLIARLYEGEDINEVVWGAKVIKTDIASSGENPASGTLPGSSENDMDEGLDNNLEEDPDIEITPVEPGGTNDPGASDEWWNDENIDDWWNEGGNETGGNEGDGDNWGEGDPGGAANGETGETALPEGIPPKPEPPVDRGTQTIEIL